MRCSFAAPHALHAFFRFRSAQAQKPFALISSSIKLVSDGKTSQCPCGHQLVSPHRRFWTIGYTQLNLRKAGFAIILLRAVLRKLTTAKPKAL